MWEKHYPEMSHGVGCRAVVGGLVLYSKRNTILFFIKESVLLFFE